MTLAKVDIWRFGRQAFLPGLARQDGFGITALAFSPLLGHDTSNFLCI